MGATMIEMSTAHRPWPAFSNNLAAMFHVATAKAPPPIPESLSSEARSFLQNCLQLDPVSSVHGCSTALDMTRL
jgi:serine/threonine protein kinase